MKIPKSEQQQIAENIVDSLKDYVLGYVAKFPDTWETAHIWCYVEKCAVRQASFVGRKAHLETLKDIRKLGI